MLSILKLRNWSTDLRVPWIARSFLSSIVTCCPVSVLNAEKMSWIQESDQKHVRTLMTGAVAKLRDLPWRLRVHVQYTCGERDGERCVRMRMGRISCWSQGRVTCTRLGSEQFGSREHRAPRTRVRSGAFLKKEKEAETRSSFRLAGKERERESN